MLMVSANRAGNNRSKRSRVGSGKVPSETNATPNAIKKLARRVRNPVTSEMPVRTVRPPTICTVAPTSLVAKDSAPCHAAVKPITALSSTKPMPARPPGYAENNRRSQDLLVRRVDLTGAPPCQDTRLRRMLDTHEREIFLYHFLGRESLQSRMMPRRTAIVTA
jgi:hypothetical protein